jgi:hypothetical protein
MPVNEASEYADWAMECHACYGPVFGDGLALKSASPSPTAVFDETSGWWLWPGGSFGDPLDRGRDSLTGAMHFSPLEVEVWSVC